LTVFFVLIPDKDFVHYAECTLFKKSLWNIGPSPGIFLVYVVFSFSRPGFIVSYRGGGGGSPALRSHITHRGGGGFCRPVRLLRAHSHVPFPLRRPPVHAPSSAAIPGRTQPSRGVERGTSCARLSPFFVVVFKSMQGSDTPHPNALLTGTWGL